MKFLVLVALVGLVWLEWGNGDDKNQPAWSSFKETVELLSSNSQEDDKVREADKTATSVLPSSLLTYASNLLEHFDPRITPLWTDCSIKDDDRDRNKTLAFVHVYKTAGSTLRQVLLSYAKQCHLGIAVLMRCSTLAHDLIVDKQDKSWGSLATHDKPEQKCRLADGFDRHRRRFDVHHGKINTRLVHDHVDVLAGHFSLGVDEYLHKKVHYLTFFRKPIDKYVSGVIYAKKGRHLVQAQLVDDLIAFVRKQRKGNQYRDSYSSYLLTPRQKKELKTRGEAKCMECRVRTILRNLVEKPVVVGLVENITASVDLLIHLIDSSYQSSDILRRAESNVVNQARTMSTSSVIRALQDEASFMEELNEYLKYDQILYDFAVQLHGAQYRTNVQTKS